MVFKVSTQRSRITVAFVAAGKFALVRFLTVVRHHVTISTAYQTCAQTDVIVI